MEENSCFHGRQCSMQCSTGRDDRPTRSKNSDKDPSVRPQTVQRPSCTAPPFPQPQKHDSETLHTSAHPTIQPGSVRIVLSSQHTCSSRELVNQINHGTDITASGISNEVAVQSLPLQNCGAKDERSFTITASHDLNWQQCRSTLRASPPVCFSAVLYFCAHGKKARKES